MLVVIGFNHNSTPLALRERLAFDAAELNNNMSELFDHAQTLAPIQGLIIVSTCNRTELYCDSDNTERLETGIFQWLSTAKNINSNELQQYHYLHSGDEALSHLFSVVSSIDSMVMGETQITGQLKFAYQVSQKTKALTQYLDQCFQYAFSVAKHIRTQTTLGESPISVASIAVKLAHRIFSQLQNKTLLLIGAGETIELVATHFKDKIAEQTKHKPQLEKHFIIANRSLKRGVELASQFDAEAIQLNELSDYLHRADIIISSTASQLPIVGKGLIERVMKQRKQRPQLIIDLAVPRDVEPEVNELDNVYLYCIDDLQTVASENLQQRQQAAKHGRSLVNEALQQWHGLNQQRQNQDIILLYRQQANILRDQAIDKAIKNLNAGDDAEAVIKQLAQQLTNKLIHKPTQGLKQIQQDNEDDKIEWSKQLLGL